MKRLLEIQAEGFEAKGREFNFHSEINLHKEYNSYAIRPDDWMEFDGFKGSK